MYEFKECRIVICFSQYLGFTQVLLTKTLILLDFDLDQFIKELTGQATKLIKPFSADKVTVKGLFQGAGQTQRPWRDPEGSEPGRVAGRVRGDRPLQCFAGGRVRCHPPRGKRKAALPANKVMWLM